MSAAVSFRPAAADDHGYILTTFAKSLRESCAYADGVPTRQRGDLLRPYLAGWVTDVAYDEDEPTVILGWATYRPGVALAWVFVRPELRRKGLGTLLLRRAVTVSEALTPFAPTRPEPRAWLAANGVTGLRFRPWMS